MGHLYLTVLVMFQPTQTLKIDDGMPPGMCFRRHSLKHSSPQPIENVHNLSAINHDDIRQRAERLLAAMNQGIKVLEQSLERTATFANLLVVRVGQSDLSIQSQSHIEPHSRERSSAHRCRDIDI